MFFCHADDGLDMVVGQCVISLTPLPAAANQLCLLQKPKLMRNRGDTHPQILADIRNAQLLLKQGIQNADPRGIAEHLKKLSHLKQSLFLQNGMLFHLLSPFIFYLPN